MQQVYHYRALIAPAYILEKIPVHGFHLREHLHQEQLQTAPGVLQLGRLPWAELPEGMLYPIM